ncbi:ubiquitin-like protein pmt3/smt3 [Euphorbia lathyris]|uniref:ubiquitin-like protein pmt3/smt3 n=1 Tax=Euphorbia lathyris TaxID=212925 RepID=UPI003313A265
MDEDNERLNIIVRTQDGGKRIYKMSKHTSVLKLLENHCQRMDTDHRSVVFLVEGERFDKNKTPAQLNLKNGTIIDALSQVHGGGLNTF